MRIRDRALRHQVGPELPRQIELHVDVERLGDVDAAVASLRRVVELAIRRVAGAGVVPGVRALERRAVERLDHQDIERRLELLQEDAERGAHDAGTHEDDVRLAGGAIFYHGPLPSAGHLDRNFAVFGVIPHLCRFHAPLLFRMRRAQVRELLQDVGVRLEACGRTLIFRQEGDAVIDHVVSEDPPVGILCGLRRIET